MLSFSLPRVTAVRHIRAHTLWLRFSDGLEGEIDFGSHLVDLTGPVLSPLRDERLFSRVRLDAGALAWPNGADWAPESLHRLVAATKKDVPRANDSELWYELRQRTGMPEISRFYGIVITMYFVDHARPHFHARFGGQAISMEIDDDGLSGSFPHHRLALLYEWRDAHRDELRANWERLRQGQSPVSIAPLD
jgi:hypothetical protein